MGTAQIKQQFNLTFNDDQLLKQAFTHSSYVNEHQASDMQDNERLEFLGDAVLELAVSHYLYDSNPKMPEGQMTKIRAAIVREAFLAKFALELKFDQYILLGKGEEHGGGRKRPALLADVFESFLGALYLDQGYISVVQFLERNIFPTLSTRAFSHQMDYKSELQEYVQQFKHLSISYEIIKETGPSHDKEFHAEVTINHIPPQMGVGRTKKEAEQRAAKKALDYLMDLQ